MIMQTDALDRIKAYAKSISVPEGALGVRSVVQTMVRAKDGATGVDYYGIANTDDVDLEQEVVLPGGADLKYIQANRKMFADHRYGSDDVVGKIRAFIPVRDGSGRQTAWRVRFHLASTEAGQTAAKIIDELGGIGLSVGFIGEEMGPVTPEEKAIYGKGQPISRIVRRWNWFELSTTCMPCNKSCQTDQVTRDEKHAAEVEKLVSRGLISRVGAQKLGLPIEAERKIHAMPRKVFVPDGKGGGIVLVRRA